MIRLFTAPSIELAQGYSETLANEDRRYIAANQTTCDILGTTLEELLGQEVGGHKQRGDEAVVEALRRRFASGRATVDRFDGSGTTLEVFYATFTTETAGMPFMATLITPLDE